MSKVSFEQAVENAKRDPEKPSSFLEFLESLVGGSTQERILRENKQSAVNFIVATVLPDDSHCNIFSDAELDAFYKGIKASVDVLDLLYLFMPFAAVQNSTMASMSDEAKDKLQKQVSQIVNRVNGYREAKRKSQEASAGNCGNGACPACK